MNRTWAWFLILVMWGGILYWVGVKRLDPDFGWHIRVGEITDKFGVDEVDPLSYTMPNFPFIDHEWLTNVAMYRLYNWGGMPVLALTSALIVVATLGLITKPGNKAWNLIPLLLGGVLFLPRAGVRPQVIDWLFLAGVLRIFEDKEIWKKWRWIVPLVILAWVNLHGGFALGVVVLGFGLFWRMAQERRIDWKDVLVWWLGVGASLINPYGARMWYEVWMQMTDHNLRWNIGEWMPFFVMIEFGVWMTIALAAQIILRYKKELPWWRSGMVVIMILAGLSSLRHLALAAVVAMPLIGWGLERFYKEVTVDKESQRRANIFYKILLVVVVIMSVWEISWTVRELVLGWGGEGAYPGKAITELRKINPQGEVFSEYGWGGYLNWKYPEKRVFIDGRMPSWRWSVPEGLIDSRWAFKDYLTVVNEGDYEELFGKYNVEVVLWPARKEKGALVVLDNWLKKFNLVKKNTNEKSRDFLIRIEKAGWERVYRDDVSEIWVR